MHGVEESDLMLYIPGVYLPGDIIVSSSTSFTERRAAVSATGVATVILYRLAYKELRAAAHGKRLLLGEQR